MVRKYHLNVQKQYVYHKTFFQQQRFWIWINHAYFSIWNLRQYFSGFERPYSYSQNFANYAVKLNSNEWWSTILIWYQVHYINDHDYNDLTVITDKFSLQHRQLDNCPEFGFIFHEKKFNFENFEFDCFCLWEDSKS